MPSTDNSSHNNSQLTTLLNLPPPDQSWLNALQSHLETTGTTPTLDDDTLLHVILHSDLRNVISSSSTISNHATALRQALENSCNNENCKAMIEYCGVMQLEEFVDVSLGAEARMGGATVPPDSSERGPPQHQQRNRPPPPKKHQRCFKLHLSDGYNDNRPIVAMETSPLSELSASSPAGLKLLLKGEIVIRFGVLMLHDGNTTVLGGMVKELVGRQKKALEIAKKKAGIGVDPTVKALIWNPLSGVEDDNDEGEGESTDLLTPATNTATAVVPVAPPAPAPVPAPPTNRFQQQQQYQQPPISNRYSRNTVPAVPVVQPLPSNPLQQQQTSLSSHRYSHSASLSNNAARHVVAPAPPAAVPNHHNPGISISNPQRQQQFNSRHSNSGSPSRPPPLSNPYRTTVTTVNATPPSSQEYQHPSSAPPTPGMKNAPLDLTSPTSPVSQRPSSSIFSPTALTLPLSFSELQTLLSKLKSNKQMYQQHISKVFIVPMKIRGGVLGFNIEKCRSANSSVKKYEYTMFCHMGGSQPSEGTVCVKLSDQVLQPFFEKTAAEMRKYSRENKAKSNELVSEGGKRVLSELKQLGNCRMMLLDAGDNRATMEKAVLLVIGRDEMRLGGL